MGDVLRIDIAAFSESHQEPLVGHDKVDHPKQKARFARGMAQRFRADAGQRKKTPDLLRVRGQEGKRRDRKLLRALAAGLAISLAETSAVLHSQALMSGRVARMAAKLACAAPPSCPANAAARKRRCG